MRTTVALLLLSRVVGSIAFLVAGSWLYLDGARTVPILLFIAAALFGYSVSDVRVSTKDD